MIEAGRRSSSSKPCIEVPLQSAACAAATVVLDPSSVHGPEEPSAQTSSAMILPHTCRDPNRPQPSASSRHCLARSSTAGGIASRGDCQNSIKRSAGLAEGKASLFIWGLSHKSIYHEGHQGHEGHEGKRYSRSPRFRHPFTSSPQHSSSLHIHHSHYC